MRLCGWLLAVGLMLLSGCASAHSAGVSPPGVLGPLRAPAARDPGAIGAPAVPAGAFPATVVRVVDGDTVVARIGGRGAPLRVRIIGVDTPETVRPDTAVACYGPQASAFTKHLLPPGTRVRAAFEPGGDTDRFGRQLWDVWLPDGRLLSAVLVAAGAGRAYPVAPQLTYADALRGLADAAAAAGRGLWGPPCRGHSFPSHRA